MEWENSFVSQLKFTSQITETQQRILYSTHKHAWKIHEHLKVGVLELVGETGPEKDRDGPQAQSAAHWSSNKHSSREVGLQPSHYSLKHQRGKKQFLSGKMHLLSSFPIKTEVDRGGQEAWKNTMVPTAFAGRKAEPRDHELALPVPNSPAESKESEEALNSTAVPKDSHYWKNGWATGLKMLPLPTLPRKTWRELNCPQAVQRKRKYPTFQPAELLKAKQHLKKKRVYTTSMCCRETTHPIPWTTKLT